MNDNSIFGIKVGVDRVGRVTVNKAFFRLLHVYLFDLFIQISHNLSKLLDITHLREHLHTLCFFNEKQLEVH